MKLTFVDVKYKHQVKLPPEFLEMLPRKVVLFLNIQFHNQYEQLKQQLEAAGKEVLSVRPKHAWHEGQILGCSVEDWDKGQEGFVYIGDGLFHPKALLFKNEEKVFIYNPKTEKIKVLTKQDIDQILKQQKGAIATFHMAKRVGVIVTTKYGQTRLRQSFKLQTMFPNKEFYFLIADVINFQKLEDFPFLDVYVNTACPRVMDDNEKVPKPMVNLEDLGIVW